MSDPGCSGASKRGKGEGKGKKAAKAPVPAAGGPEGERLLRMDEVRDVKAFAEKCFPDFCRLPFSPLHEYLFERRRAKIALPLERRAGALDVVLAPRGAAKSTLVSLVFPLHAILFGHDRYIVLVSATLRQASRKIANMRSALGEGGRLWKIFGPEAAKPGERRKRWLRRSTDLVLELEQGRIEAFSAGAELRGISFGPWRPTWIILDDVERGDRVRRESHREALAEWFAETVENLGDKSTHIDALGTLLHPEALPARLMRRPDAASKAFASILSEAGDQLLWDEWRRIYRNPADPGRIAAARAFFEERREAMLAGARVLWPAKEDYYALQTLREKLGRGAFNKEKQNDPAAAGAGLFRRDRLRWFRMENGNPAIVGEPEANAPAANGLRRFGFLDPSLGSPHSDFCAIATVGLDAAGRLYALDVWLAHAAPSEQIARLFDLHAEWDYELFGIETNAFQRLLLDPLEAERERRRAAGRPWDVPIEERRHRGSKAERILSLEPLAESGRLLFNESLCKLFVAQMEEFPEGRHDDGPDALAAAAELAGRHALSPKGAFQSTPRRERGGAESF